MVIDVVVVGLLLVGIWYGWKKGLVRLVSGWAGWILRPYIALRFSGSAAGFFDQQFGLTEKWADYFVQHQALLKVGGVFKLILSPFFRLAKNVSGGDPGAASENMLPEVLAQSLAGILLNILSFILLLILAKWAINLISSLITSGLDHTFVGTLNRFSGGVLSFVFVFIFVGIMLATTAHYAAGSDVGQSGAGGYLSGAFSKSIFSLSLADFFDSTMGQWIKFW